MSIAETDFVKQLMEMTVAVMELKAHVELAETKHRGAEERARLMLDAKDLWMRRALEAEKKLEAVK